jgi:excisionase family DNA binding protein
MTGCEPDASAPGIPVDDQIIGLAFGKYVMTAADSDVVKLTRLSRSVIYEQIRAGRLRTVKQGTATLITAAALDDYVRLLEQEARSRQ